MGGSAGSASSYGACVRRARFPGPHRRISLREERGQVNEKAWIAFIASCILLIAALSIRRDDSRSISPPSGDKTAIPMVESSAVPLVTGDESIQDQFIRAGCPVCHTIPGIAGAHGQVGPPLLLGKTGPARLADPRYSGRAKTVREYIVESIVAPQDYIVPGYPERTMPPSPWVTNSGAAPGGSWIRLLEKVCAPSGITRSARSSNCRERSKLRAVSSGCSRQSARPR